MATDSLFAWICVLAAGALGLLGESGLLGDLLIGAGLGALLGKLVIGSLERGGRELSGPRARQLDRAWIGAGIALVLGIDLATELL